MDDNEIAQVVLLMRRAPLHNMDEAEAVSKLIDKTLAVLRNSQQRPTLRVIDNATEGATDHGSG